MIWHDLFTPGRRSPAWPTAQGRFPARRLGSAEGASRSRKPIPRSAQASRLSLAGQPQDARAGSSHLDCIAQFEYINKPVLAFQKWNKPEISGDTKKKKSFFRPA
jgi:hypothetical protein